MRALILLVERAQPADEHEPDGNRSGPIVLIHGFSASQVIWSRLLPTLQAEHPTLAVTLDGHTGGRPIASEKVSAAALADGVERDMDAAGFETATIVGNSLGGWLALELARRRRASSVVAIAPGGSWEPGSDADEHLRAHLVQNGKSVRRLLSLLQFAVRWPRLRRLVFAGMAVHGERIDPSMAAEMLRASARFSIQEELIEAMFAPGAGLDVNGIDCPVLLAWGADDRLTPKEVFGQRVRARLPQAPWRELPDAGHIPMLDAPEAVAVMILQFVAEHGAADPDLSNRESRP